MSLLKNELKILFKHGSVYGLAEILSRLVGFLMIPVYTSYLKATGYGISEISGLTFEIVGIILNMGLANAVYRFYYDREINKSNKVMSTACVGIPIVGFIVLGIISLFSRQIASVVLEGSEQGIYIFLATWTLWFNQQLNQIYTYLRVTESSGKYLVLSISKLIMALSLNILFIVGLGWGVLGMFTANLITAGLFTVVFYPFLLKRVGLKVDITVAKVMLRFSMPIIPANLASYIVNASDRFFIKAFFSMADVGIYSLGHKFGTIVFYLVRTPFMQIWEPRRYALYREGAPAGVYAKITTYFVGLMIFVGLCISVYIQDVIKVISPAEFWGAYVYIPAIVLCYIIYALDHHVAFGILLDKKTEYWTYVNLVMAALNLTLNFILIPHFKIWGAICANFLSLVFKISALHIIARKFFAIPFEWTRMAGILSVSALLYLISVLINPSGLIQALMFDTFLIMLFLPLIWITGLINAEEKKSTIAGIARLYEKRKLLKCFSQE
jgi:O-antigen/teichoic acid export membrane protein